MTMIRPLLIVLVMIAAMASYVSPVAAQDEAPRYRVEYFNCYLVGLYGVFEGDKKGFEGMVSRPYGHGAVDDLEQMVKRWNRRGICSGDEERLARKLTRKGLFTFPESTGPKK